MADSRDADAGGDGPDGEQVARIRRADTLAQLAVALEAASEHEAYVAAKRLWRRADLATLRPDAVVDGLPGDRVRIGDLTVTVHGITHADSDAEGAFVRRHVRDYLDRGATVFCEQGIRPMYFDGLPAVCAMDDYRWAMRQCARLDLDGHVENFHAADLEDLVPGQAALAATFREAAFGLIESGRDIYGDEFAATLGDVASSFLVSHEDRATGQDFEAFRRTRRAARDPGRLPDLQAYYWRAFLPQPLEREWLRRHDRELEIVTHARNERMADYVVNEADASAVHVVVGAAHQPGVTYYLEQYRDGAREPGDFEYVE